MVGFIGWCSSVGMPLAALLVVSCTNKEEQDYDDAKAAVSNLLIDPTSPLFRDVRQGSGDGIICGEVNARNQFGAYNGFVRFYVDNSLGGNVASIEPEYDPDHLSLLDGMCRDSMLMQNEMERAGMVPTTFGATPCQDAADYSDDGERYYAFTERWNSECSEPLP